MRWFSSLHFRLTFAYTVSVLYQSARWRDFVVRCKGCGEDIPAPVETLPASWIAARVLPFNSVVERRRN